MFASESFCVCVLQTSGTLLCAVSGAPPHVPVAVSAVPSAPSAPAVTRGSSGRSRDILRLTVTVHHRLYGPFLLHLHLI